jgi:hypothetical protein
MEAGPERLLRLLSPSVAGRGPSAIGRFLFFGALLFVACSKQSAEHRDARGVADAGRTTISDASTGSTAAPFGSSTPPDASAVTGAPADRGERIDASTPSPAPPALLRALAGKDDWGLAWIPVKGQFLFDDLVLHPDGTYDTHLHERPGSFGHWRVDGDTLTLDAWLGDGEFVVRGLRVDGRRLQGGSSDGPLVMRRFDPRRAR